VVVVAVIASCNLRATCIGEKGGEIGASVDLTPL
jgi:hypothetical protein